MDPEKPLISVLIPNWKGAADTVECLETLHAQDYGAAHLEIVIVDNGSQDDSVTTIRTKLAQIGSSFHRYELIEFKENKGIAIAYNRALESVSPEAVVLLRLDNDVLLRPNAVSRLMARLSERQDVAVVGCRIISYDTSPKRTHHDGAHYVRWWSQKMKFSFPDTDVDCDGVAGCAMLIRKDVVLKLPWFFDSSRFLADEMDLCQRVRELGYQVVYTPSVEVFHKGGRSTSKKRSFVHFEELQDGYMFRLRYSRLPALGWYLFNAGARAVAKWIQGDDLRVRALRQAWIEVRKLRRAIR